MKATSIQREGSGAFTLYGYIICRIVNVQLHAFARVDESNVVARSGLFHIWKGTGLEGMGENARSEGADLKAYMETRREASDGRQVYVALHHPI